MRVGRIRWLILMVASIPFWVGCNSRETAPNQPVAISVPELGCEITLPDGFRFTGFHDYYYEALSDDVRVRIHRADPRAKTPAEALQFSTQLRAKIKAEASEERKRGIFVFLSSEPFRSQSGLEGIKAYFGPEGARGERVDFISYYVGLPGGRVVCICLNRPFRVARPVPPFEKLEEVGAVVLQTVKAIPVVDP